MNNKKLSNPVRLIAFFLTAVILTLTFGFTADGWTMNSQVTDSSENSQNEDLTDGSSDIIISNPKDENAIEPSIKLPKFLNKLTGLETTEIISKSTPFAFVMDGTDSLFGISRSDLLIEIPIEKQKTRLISFISDTENLWKIGSIAKGRGYINNLINYFGGLAVYNGIDDITKYDFCDLGDKAIDFSIKEGYHYTEFLDYAYTHCDLLNTLKSTYEMENTMHDETRLPFVFNEFGNECIRYDKIASKIEFTDDGYNLKLTYNKESKKYTHQQNGITRVDPLNGKKLDFVNCFILFADSITYDNSSGCQLVMNTIGSGLGFYITEGSYTEIKWQATQSGTLSFYLTDGEKLTINRGNSYICYLKSSKINNVSFS